LQGPNVSQSYIQSITNHINQYNDKSFNDNNNCNKSIEIEENKRYNKSQRHSIDSAHNVYNYNENNELSISVTQSNAQTYANISQPEQHIEDISRIDNNNPFNHKNNHNNHNNFNNNNINSLFDVSSSSINLNTKCLTPPRSETNFNLTQNQVSVNLLEPSIPIPNTPPKRKQSQKSNSNYKVENQSINLLEPISKNNNNNSNNNNNNSNINSPLQKLIQKSVSNNNICNIFEGNEFSQLQSQSQSVNLLEPSDMQVYPTIIHKEKRSLSCNSPKQHIDVNSLNESNNLLNNLFTNLFSIYK